MNQVRCCGLAAAFRALPLTMIIGAVLTSSSGAPAAQQQPPPRPAPGTFSGNRGIGVPVPRLADGPWVFDTAEQHKIRVSVVARGLANPWSLAFLPDGAILVTERPGRLRVIRDGVLDPQPVAGVPEARAQRLGGMMDLALHPRFSENGFVYITYSKGGEKGLIATALARGRWDGTRLVDTRDLFVATPWWDGNGGAASRLAFGRDNMVYMTTGSSVPNMKDGQEPGHHKGKVLRLRDDGTAPPDNPFAGKPGYQPEIYSLGHRNQLGLAIHPETGAVWANEQGPNGGDEINIILPGRNYGWPDVSLGRDYQGPWQGQWTASGSEPPLVFWSPSIAISGMAFYTADRFPAWRGNVFVGALRFGEIPGTGHLHRVVFNANGDEIRREMLLTELRQRIRDVRQGPDGLLYVLTDENPGALLKIEPAP
jgi:glucose/arabinose dehydrogenase